MLSADASPSKEKDAQQPKIDKQMYFLTVYDHPHILEENIDDLKYLRCRRSSLVFGKSVQPLKNCLDLILSEELLCEFLCIALSKVIRQ